MGSSGTKRKSVFADCSVGEWVMIIMRTQSRHMVILAVIEYESNAIIERGKFIKKVCIHVEITYINIVD